MDLRRAVPLIDWVHRRWISLALLALVAILPACADGDSNSVEKHLANEPEKSTGSPDASGGVEQQAAREPAHCSGLATQEPPGAQLIEITGPDCLGRLAGHPALPGNTAKSVAVYDAAHNYVTFFSRDDPRQVHVMSFDGRSCEPSVQVNAEPGGDRSHDAPSVFVDGSGHVYATYFGFFHRSGKPRPSIRRTRKPLDLTQWEPEGRARLFNSGELGGFRLDDGSVVVVGSNFSGRIDVLEAGGDWRWPAMRQVVGQDPRPLGTTCNSKGNRFTKAVFAPGWTTSEGSQILVTTWGWGSGFRLERRPADLCEDIRGYNVDSHQVFFAWSDDLGLTWQNKDRTKRVEAPLCPEETTCWRGDGIRFDDPAFRLTTTRQRSHRAIWAHDDGTIYIAFEKSSWCEGTGSCEQRNVKQPGALMMLRFKLGGPVEEFMVHPDPHVYTAGIRRAGGSIYIWSKSDRDRIAWEYRSDDDGASWSRTKIMRAERVQGLTRIPCLDSMRLVITTPVGKDRRVYYYRRTFSP